LGAQSERRGRVSCGNLDGRQTLGSHKATAQHFTKLLELNVVMNIYGCCE
jgi:hypothetical protein